jgi:hypothetical protein
MEDARKHLGEVDPDDLDPWERQPNESEAAWLAFVAYRDLEGGRSLKRAAAKLGKGTRALERFSSDWKWSQRCGAYDRWLDAQRRKELAEKNQKVVERQREHLGKAAQALVEPVEAFLRKVQEKYAEGGNPFEEMTFAQLQALAIEAVRYMPAIVQAERLVTGLSLDPAGVGSNGGKEEAVRALESATRDELERILTGDGNERDDGRAAQLSAAGVDPENPH